MNNAQRRREAKRAKKEGRRIDAAYDRTMRRERAVTSVYPTVMTEVIKQRREAFDLMAAAEYRGTHSGTTMVILDEVSDMVALSAALDAQVVPKARLVHPSWLPDLIANTPLPLEEVGGTKLYTGELGEIDCGFAFKSTGFFGPSIVSLIQGPVEQTCLNDPREFPHADAATTPPRSNPATELVAQQPPCPAPDET